MNVASPMAAAPQLKFAQKHNAGGQPMAAKHNSAPAPAMKFAGAQPMNAQPMAKHTAAPAMKFAGKHEAAGKFNAIG